MQSRLDLRDVELAGAEQCVHVVEARFGKVERPHHRVDLRVGGRTRTGGGGLVAPQMLGAGGGLLGNYGLQAPQGIWSPDFVASLRQLIQERLKGASAGTANCPCGTSLVSVKVLPAGKDLSTSTQTAIVVTTSLQFQVTVKNSGNVQIFSVPVKLTIEQVKGGNIVKTAKIGFLNPGDETTLTFRNIPQVNFSTPATIKIEISPVNGETNTGNNSADYPVIFSVVAP